MVYFLLILEFNKLGSKPIGILHMYLLIFFKLKEFSRIHFILIDMGCTAET